MQLLMAAMERDTIFYMLDPGPRQGREFISGVVVGGGGDSLVIQFARSWLGVSVDDVIPLHYKIHGRFMSRDHHVVRITEDEAGMRLKLQPIGDEPEAKDLRGSERIPTNQETMIARLGDESDCPVLDISESGIAVMGGRGYARGDVVEFDMWVDGGQHFGLVTVCSAIEVRSGRFRYGLKCNEDQEGHNLRTNLPKLWEALQIKHLEMMML